VGPIRSRLERSELAAIGRRGQGRRFGIVAGLLLLVRAGPDLLVALVIRVGFGINVGF
jgi:hypothetical protein